MESLNITYIAKYHSTLYEEIRKRKLTHLFTDILGFNSFKSSTSTRWIWENVKTLEEAEDFIVKWKKDRKIKNFRRFIKSIKFMSFEKSFKRKLNLEDVKVLEDLFNKHGIRSHKKAAHGWLEYSCAMAIKDLAIKDLKIKTQKKVFKKVKKINS